MTGFFFIKNFHKGLPVRKAGRADTGMRNYKENGYADVDVGAGAGAGAEYAGGFPEPGADADVDADDGAGAGVGCDSRVTALLALRVLTGIFVVGMYPCPKSPHGSMLPGNREDTLSLAAVQTLSFILSNTWLKSGNVGTVMLVLISPRH